MAILIQSPKGKVSNDIVATVPKTSNVERAYKVLKKSMSMKNFSGLIHLVVV